MAAVCDICAKGPGFGHNVSHSHRRTKRRFDPNIQRVRAVVNGSPKRLNVCTSLPQGREGHPLATGASVNGSKKPATKPPSESRW